MADFAELIVMSSARPDRDADYVDWYVNRHLPDMRAVPGIISGGFFQATPAEPSAPGSYLARYRVDSDVDEVLARVFARAGKEEMPLTDAMDPASVLMLAATGLQDAGPPDEKVAGDLFAAFASPVAGQEDVFAAWYDKRHLPDVLAVPGVISGARYALARETAGKAAPWTFAALCAVAPGQADAVATELRARAGGPQMPISPAFNRERAHAVAYERLA